MVTDGGQAACQSNLVEIEQSTRRSNRLEIEAIEPPEAEYGRGCRTRGATFQDAGALKCLVDRQAPEQRHRDPIP
jgi:hypothetical protein